jgi:hypothetical protein
MPNTTPNLAVPSVSLTFIQTGALQAEPMRPPAASAAEQDALITLVDSLRQAAMHPPALQKLAAVILENEPGANGHALAMMLRPEPSRPSSGGAPAAGTPGQVVHLDDAPDSATTRASLSPDELDSMKRLWQDHVHSHVHRIRVDVDNAEHSAALAYGTAQEREDAINRILASVITTEIRPHAAAGYQTRMSDLSVSPQAPRSLHEFALRYLREHPDMSASAFYLPFHELAQRDIEIPQDLARAFERGILPYETFRDLVATYIRPLPPRAPTIYTQDSWGPYTYWDQALTALCSDAALALLDGGRMTRDTLLDWIGIRHHIQHLRPGEQASLDASHGPSTYPEAEQVRPINLLLAEWGFPISKFAPVSDLRLLQEPEKLLAMTDNLVPFPIVNYLVSIAPEVDWPVLANEMDRVTAAYAGHADALRATMQRNRGLTDEEAAHAMAIRKVFHYNSRFDPAMTQEDTRQLAQSQANMTPYVQRHHLLSQGRLDSWELTGLEGDGPERVPHFQLHPSRAHFDRWSAQGIPVPRQTVMGQLCAQGFHPAFAEALVNDHAEDLARLRAWVSPDNDADLGWRLDQTMTAAVARWLDDPTIPAQALALAPRMIQCDMKAEQIDRILHDPAACLRAAAVFGPRPSAAWQVWAGFATGESLYERIVNGDESEDELRDAAQQEQQRLSDLRRNLAETRERLRRMCHAAELLRFDRADRTPHSQRCAQFVDAWKDTIKELDALLQPTLEQTQNERPGVIAATLSYMSAQLAFQVTNLDMPDRRAGAPTELA